MANRIQIRRDSQSNWERINPVLADGELGLNYNNNQIKIGNGTDVWNTLAYATGIPTFSSEIVAAPATNTSVGIVGQMAFDENYIYRCVQSNVWKRTALNADTW
jgi:hypothetical protein